MKSAQDLPSMSHSGVCSLIQTHAPEKHAEKQGKKNYANRNNFNSTIVFECHISAQGDHTKDVTNPSWKEKQNKT